MRTSHQVVPRETTNEADHARQEALTTLRLARQGESRIAAAEVALWGYRDFEAGEVDRAMWVAIERGSERCGWMWFEWVGNRRDALLHLCAHPENRRRAHARHVIAGMRWAAELMGAERLWVVAPEERISGYMRRLGWREMKEGAFMLATRRAGK